MPKITRLFSVSERVQLIELFCDCMEKKRLILIFSFPNVINSFPKQLPALTSLHIATTFGQQMHWDVIALVSQIAIFHLLKEKEEGLIGHSGR